MRGRDGDAVAVDHESATGKSSDSAMHAEGDINLSPLRREWDANHVGPVTRALLDEDAHYFLHQSLSTDRKSVV